MFLEAIKAFQLQFDVFNENMERVTFRALRELHEAVGRNGCIALHYYVHFLRIFSFVTHGIEFEGIGARSVRSTLRLCHAQPAREKEGIDKDET